MNLLQFILTTCLFVLMMLGHFVGDYLFQNNRMALNKSKRNKEGWYACGVHSFVYTLSIVIFLRLVFPALCFNLWVWAAIGIPHYIIDHYSLASYWMKWKNGVKPFESVSMDEKVTVETTIVNDNTIHWVMLYFTCMALVCYNLVR